MRSNDDCGALHTRQRRLFRGCLALAAGGATLGLAAGIAIVAALAAEQAQAAARAEAYADTLEEGTQRVTDGTRNMAKEALAAERSWMWMSQGSTYDNAEALGISLELVTDAAMGSSSAMEQLQEQIEASETGHDDLGLSAQSASLFADRLRDAVKGEASSLEEAIDQARQKEQVDRDVAASTGDAAAVADSAASSYLEESEKIAGVTEELDKLIASFNEANGIGQDAVTTNAAWQESLAGISADVQAQRDAFEQANGTVAGFSLSLAENTVSGSANAAMLAGVASDAQRASAAQYEVEKTTLGSKAAADNYSATLAAQRQAFINSATGAGYNADEVQRLADRVFGLPSEKQIEVLANTADASANVWRLIRSFDGAKINIPVVGGISSRGERLAYAGGGQVRGPGTGTSDSIAAWVSNGEFIVKESVASRNIELLHHLNAGGRIPAYAGGGTVGLAAASSGSQVPMLGLTVASPASAVEPLPTRGTAGREQSTGPSSVVATISDAQLDRLGKVIGETVYPLIMTGAQRTVRTAMRG